MYCWVCCCVRLAVLAHSRLLLGTVGAVVFGGRTGTLRRGLKLATVCTTTCW